MERTEIRQMWPMLLIIFVFSFGGAWGPAAGSSGADPAPDPAPMGLRGLGAEEIKALQAGDGMGLARPAELHGYPGPAHVLEAARDGKLKVYAEQRQAIERIHARVKAEARALGKDILALEGQLEAGFRSGRIGEGDLVRLVEEIGRKRAALRLVHLRAHLLTAALLRPEQIEEYYQLRGLPAEPSPRLRGH